MAKRSEIAIVRAALQEFEEAAIPGGGGYAVCLLACVKWENVFREHERKLTPPMAGAFKKRAAIALDNAMKP